MLEMFDDKSKDKSAQRAEAYFWRALKHMSSDRHGQAVKELENAIKIDAKNALPLFEEQLTDFYREKRITESLTLGSVLIKHKQDDYKLANLMGNIHRKLGESKKANEFYKKAIGLNKKSETALLNLAASMAKVPLFDRALNNLIEKYINFKSYLIPLSTFPRNPEIIKHLTEMLNMKQFFGKVDRLQELILKKALTQKEPDLEKMSILVERVQQKIHSTIHEHSANPDIQQLLQDALSQDWKKLSHGEKDQFLWDVLNLALYIFQKYNLKSEKDESAAGSTIDEKGLQSVIDCFFRLKVEGYSYRYLDMVIALSHALSGDKKQAIDQLKDVAANDPNDRYLNINLGLLYHQTGNRLLSRVHLLKGAYLLRELGGVCHLSEIIEKADEMYQDGDLKKALVLYKAAAVETDSIEILIKIGEIMIALHRYADAVQPFKEILRVEPDSKLAAENLKEIQEHYTFMADEFFNAREFIKASEHYEKALEINRPAEILQKAAKAYKLQGDHKQEFSLETELRDAVAREKEQEQETIRIQFVKAGVKAMQNSDLQKAISHFNEAFRIQKSKDVFMYLSYLYKKLNQKQALLQLVKQWKAVKPAPD